MKYKNKRRFSAKRLKVLLLFCMVLCLCGAAGSGPGTACVSAASATTGAKKKNGWVTSAGKKYYYRNGKKVTGWQTIKKKRYYFNKKGVMKTGLQKISGKYYYLNKKGALQTGFQTIGESRYYFSPTGSPQGQMATGWVSIGYKRYYFKKNGVLVESRTKSITSLEKQLLKIVDKKTKTSDSTNEKLSKLFQYVTWTYNYNNADRNTTPGGEDWYKKRAQHMLSTGGGTCYHYASLFACLAEKATDLPVRVGYGYTQKLGGGTITHSWCEIKINGTWYVFDPDAYRYFAAGNCYYKTMSQVGYMYLNRRYTEVEF